MTAIDIIKAIAVLNANLAEAITKANNAGLDAADIAAVLSKAAEIVENE